MRLGFATEAGNPLLESSSIRAVSFLTISFFSSDWSSMGFDDGRLGNMDKAGGGGEADLFISFSWNDGALSRIDLLTIVSSVESCKCGIQKQTSSFQKIFFGP